MDVFNVMLVMSLGSYIHEENKLDIISKLPYEIAIMILRKLDGRSLIKACRVNKKWHNLCKMDKQLRKKIREYKNFMKIQRHELIYGELGGELNFVPKNENGAFKRRNIQQINTGIQPVVRRVAVSNQRSDVPLVILEKRGTDISLQSAKRKLTEVKQKPKGISKSKKRRLLR